LLLTFVETVRSRLLTRVALRAEQCLGAVLLRATMEDQRAGRPDAGQALRDLYMLRGFVTGSALNALFDAPIVPLYVILLFAIHTTICMIAIWGAAAILLLALLNQRATSRSLHQANQGMNRLLSSAELQTRNADVVSAMGLAPTLIQRFARRHDA